MDSKSIELLKVANELLHNSFPVRYVLVKTLHTKHGVGFFKGFRSFCHLCHQQGCILYIENKLYVLVRQWEIYPVKLLVGVYKSKFDWNCCKGSMFLERYYEHFTTSKYFSSTLLKINY